MEGARFFVLEKPAARAEKGKLKDGVHIVCPDIVLPFGVQKAIRLATIPLVADSFAAHTANAMGDCYDEAVLGRNGWLMYGSSKAAADGGATQPAWLVTKALKVVVATEAGGDGSLPYALEPAPLLADHADYIELLSIRNKHEPTPLCASAPAPLVGSKETPRIVGGETEAGGFLGCKEVAARRCHGGASAARTTARGATADVPYEVLEAAVMFLPERYYGHGSYDLWMKMLWGIMHTAEAGGYPREGAELCHAFSKRALGAYCPVAVDEKIRQRAGSHGGGSDGDGGGGVITFGSIMHFVRLEYAERLIRSLPAEERPHGDIALCLAAMHASSNGGGGGCEAGESDFKRMWHASCGGSLDAWRGALVSRRLPLYGLKRLGAIAARNDPEAARRLHEMYTACVPPRRRAADGDGGAALPRATLHDGAFDWDGTPHAHRYCLADAMIPPRADVGLQVLVGGMGTGKTKAVAVLLEQVPPGASVIFATHSRVLSNKLAAQFDLTNYQDVDPREEYTITDAGLVCCLDSLPRVDRTAFDVVVLDEVLSLLHHFHSKVMKNRADVCQSFLALMTLSARVVCVDAFGDNQLVRRFVEQLHKQRVDPECARFRAEVFPEAAAFPQEPRWSCNTWVRDPGASEFFVEVNHSLEMEQAFKLKFIGSVSEQVHAHGKRVAIACSNKTMVDNLRIMFESKQANDPGCRLIRVQCYTGKTDRATMREHTANVDEAWRQADVVIFSPCIGPGISCELVNHFNAVMAFFDNSTRAPPVDTCIQQLFRCRMLADRTYHVYITSPVKYSAPVAAWEVERALAREDAYVTELGMEADSLIAGYTLSPATKERIYDTGSLFYHILVGNMINRGMSLRMFADIIVAALRDDRGGRVDVRVYADYDAERDPKQQQAAEAGGRRQRAMRLVQEEGSHPRKELAEKEREERENNPIATFEVITEAERDQLRELEDGGAVLDRRQLQEKLNYDVAVEEYGIWRGRADKAFIKEYVGSADCLEAADRAWCTRYTFELFRDAVWYGLEAFIATKRVVLDGYKEDVPGVRMIGFKTSSKVMRDKMGMEAACMLRALLPGGVGGLKQHPFVIKEQAEVLHGRLAAHLGGFSPERMKEMLSLFGIKRKKGEDGSSKKARTHLIKGVLGKGMNLCVTAVGKRHMTFDASAFNGLVVRYRPRSLLLPDEAAVDCMGSDDEV